MRKDTFRHRLATMLARDPHRFYILLMLYLFCTLLYYFGELVDSAGWEALRWNFFYTVHDIHRLFFLAPIIYAGYVFGVKATIISTIISASTFLPRALFVSPFPDPLLRAELFIIIAGIMGYLVAIVRRGSKQRSHLKALLRSETGKFFRMLDGVEEEVLIIGPDYRIRFLSPSMIRDFGEGIGSYCYEYLHKSSQPCCQVCKLPNVVNGAIERWEHKFPDGRTCEVLASPYTDFDMVVCQFTIFRNITRGKKD